MNDAISELSRFEMIDFCHSSLHLPRALCASVVNNRTQEQPLWLKLTPPNMHSPIPNDVDPAETAEWLESLDYVLESKGPGARAAVARGARRGGAFATASSCRSPPPRRTSTRSRATSSRAYPGNRELERRIKSFIRWNAMAMVTRANRDFAGIGGHISTFASSATLYEVASTTSSAAAARAATTATRFTSKATPRPACTARAFLEGRLTEQNLDQLPPRVAAEAAGCRPIRIPWLMPDFWEFPTVSMGLGPIMAIYQARFNRYLTDRGINDLSNKHVWAFLGDGECDEPETLGAITLASREKLDN